jgi:hypothetical protein
MPASDCSARLKPQLCSFPPHATRFLPVASFSSQAAVALSADKEEPASPAGARSRTRQTSGKSISLPPQTGSTTHPHRAAPDSGGGGSAGGSDLPDARQQSTRHPHACTTAKNTCTHEWTDRRERSLAPVRLLHSLLAAVGGCPSTASRHQPHGQRRLASGVGSEFTANDEFPICALPYARAN